MRTKRKSSPWKGILQALLMGFTGCLCVCLAGSVLIERAVLQQQWDAIVSGISLAVGILSTIALALKWTNLKKWVAILTVDGVTLCIMLAGNLLIPQSDLSMLGYHCIVIAVCSIVNLLISGRNPHHYRI